jgi:hypothetical protein
MRILACALILTASIFGLVGPAFAADMTGAEIKAFVSGKTAYLETTADSSTGKAGQGVIYWAEDGTALYKTPMGAIWHGKRSFQRIKSASRRLCSALAAS